MKNSYEKYRLSDNSNVYKAVKFALLLENVHASIISDSMSSLLSNVCNNVFLNIKNYIQWY